MYGYGQFTYNPGSMSNMQDRLGYSRPMTNILSGRIVTGIEEARASQIPLDGTVSYFPSPAENVIYAKSIDMQGLPVFLTYELKMPNIYNQTAKTEQNVQISDLVCRINAIEEKIKELTKHEPTANATSTNA